MATRMRCYLPPGRWEEGSISLGRDESHYLTQVLRGTPGRQIELFDGEGQVAEATITSVGRHQVVVEAGPSRMRPMPVPAFHLVQGLPKAHKMDLIVQKATELGVQRIQPLLTRHAVARPDELRGERKIARWQAVALAAVRQCGGAHIPRIASVSGLKEWLHSPERPATLLVGDLRPAAREVREVLEPMRAHPPEAVAFLIGPEGDLSPDELDALGAAHAHFVRLGDSILRTETAALHAIGLLRYALR